jgi:hypothetical protein
MTAIPHHSTDETWGRQLRRWAAELQAAGQPARARELDRLADKDFKEEMALHPDRDHSPTLCNDVAGCHGHRSFAEAFVCALLRNAQDQGRELERLNGIIRRAAACWDEYRALIAPSYPEADQVLSELCREAGSPWPWDEPAATGLEVGR